MIQRSFKMTSLFTAVTSSGRTENGAVTNTHTDNFCLDLFFKIGASRGKDLTREFLLAKGENQELATSILLWSRDVREGAGERQIFKDLVKHIANDSNIHGLVNKIIELGRWDDLLVFLDTPYESVVTTAYVNGVAANNALAAKWLPRKGKAFNLVRKAMGVDPKTLRKRIVELSQTVEQKMCAKQWSGIKYSSVPSVASSRYSKAFSRNDTERYVGFLESVKKGKEKINASTVYPYDITKNLRYGNSDTAEVQWNSLPNYMEGFEGRMLPVIDVSRSMACPAGGSTTVDCMEVAVGLGLYIAERSTGAFNNVFATFHEKPSLLKFNDGMSLKDKVTATYKAPWGGSTNLIATFDLILNAAVQHNVPENEMPTHLVVLSDMEFNAADRKYETNHQAIKRKYSDAGYTLPQIIYWNLKARNNNFPVRSTEFGAALVSGFSPSLLKSITSGDVNPEQMMLRTVNKERYSLKQKAP
jgi:hypothetical protein